MAIIKTGGPIGGGSGSITTTDATLTTLMTIPMYDDYMNYIKAHVVGQMSLFSHFSGASKADNQGFTAGIGDWTQGSGGTLASTAGGQTGNGGKYTVGVSPSTTLPLLNAGLDNLVVGRKYRLTFYAKYETAWGGGNLTATIDGQTVVAALTTSFALFQLDFVAAGTTPTISLTCASAPTAADILWIDTFELTELSSAAYELKAGVSNLGGDVNMVGTVTADFLKEDNTAWDCQLNISGTDLLVQVQGVASGTIKWAGDYEHRIVGI